MEKKQVVAALILMTLSVVILFSFNVLGGDISADTTNYVVTAEGYGGPVQLKVSLKDEAIVNIEILEQNETPNLGDVAIEATIEKILENQSTDVDVHTGATFSSNAVINAVAKAYEEAGMALGVTGATSGEAEDQSSSDYEAEGILAIAQGYGGDVVLDVIMEGNTLVDIKVLSQKETPNLGDVAIEAMIEKILQAQSPDVDVESGATASSQAVINAVGKASGQQVAESEPPQDPAAAYDLESYEPEGIFVSGKGFQDRYDIFLDVIFNGNEISEIRVIEHNETRGFGDGALRAVPERMISQQSTEVDVQSGATWTSKAAMKIVREAVEQSGILLAEREGTTAAAPASGGG